MTQPTTSSPLLAGFRNGLGEIVHLVSDASEKTGPWVASRIGKFSKKAQDEIYGRFNAAFNGGVKDAAKGRAFLESSLDFVALTEKITEVADDIELADKINKLFNNAPAQTVNDLCNKLSHSAQIEIGKQLTTTGVNATFQEALVTVFAGMGTLESETIQSSGSRASSKASSSPSSSKTSSKSARPSNADELNQVPDLAELEAELQKPEVQKAIKGMLLHIGQVVKRDMDLANAHVDIIESKGELTPEAIKARNEGIPKLYQELSSAAGCMVGKILIEKSQGSPNPYTSADEATPEHLREAIEEFFAIYSSAAINYDRLLEKWKFNEEEVVLTHFYYRVCHDFYNALPHFKDNKAVVADKEFEQLFKTEMSTLIKPVIQIYAQLFIKASELPYKRAEAVVRKEKHLITDILDQILNPLTDAKRSYELYTKALPKNIQEALQLYLDEHHDKVLFKKATKTQRAEAAQAYMSFLVEAQIEKQQNEDALKNATLSFAVFFLKDCNILRQNAAFLKTKEQKYKQDQAKVLEIFDSLSPFARLLVEQEYIRDYPHGLTKEKMTADTMRALVAEASPDFVKGSMLSLLDGFDRNFADFSITSGMKLENLGTAEKLSLKAYLGYPRHISFAFLQSNPNGTIRALAKYLPNNMQAFHKDVVTGFQNTVLELGTLKDKYKKLFEEFNEQTGENKNLTEEDAANGMKAFLFEKRVFTKKDFFIEVTSLEKNIEKLVQQ